MNQRKKLSIIIPFYGQTVEELAIPLQSINLQTGIDFSDIDVQLVNDGGSPVDSEQFKQYLNLDLHYHELKENVGPGLARQYGIDHSDSDWLMFIDADDELIGATALAAFFQVEKVDSEASILRSDLIQETKDEKGQFVYKIHSNDKDIGLAAVYAKCFRRDFINRIGLRFSDELRVFEDAYFTDIALLMADKIVGFSEPKTYLYHYNEKSITHDDEVITNFDLRNLVTKEKLELRFYLKNAPEKFDYRMDNFLVDLYFYQQFYPDATVTFAAETQEFLPFYKIKFSKLMQLAKTKSQQNGSLSFGRDVSGFKAFLDLIKQQIKIR